MHANIRADPAPEKKERGEKPEEKTKWKQAKLTYEQRKTNLKVQLLVSHNIMISCSIYVYLGSMTNAQWDLLWLSQ